MPPRSASWQLRGDGRHADDGMSVATLSRIASSSPGRAASRLPAVSSAAMAVSSCCWRSARVKSLSPSPLRDRAYASAVVAVQVLAAGLDEEALGAGQRVPVARIVDRSLDREVDPAERVDRLAQALHVDRGEVVDARVEQLADRRLERGRTAERVRRPIGAGCRHERVELGVVDASVAERHAVQVAWHRDHGPVTGHRVERGDEHRVGQVRVCGPARSRSDEEDRQPLAVGQLRLHGRRG